MLPFKRTSIVVIVVTAALAVSMLSLIGTLAVRADSSIIRVDAHAPGPAHDGSSWSTAYTNLQVALDAASSGDKIWVADGVYTPTNTIGLTATFALKPGVALYGGFGGYGISETQRTQRDWMIYKSILSGDLDGNDLNADGNFIAEVYSDIVGNNVYHVVIGSGVTETAVLDGFTITAGNANGSHNPNFLGGGMYNNDGSPMLVNLTFSGNRASAGGGGMFNNYSNSAMTNVTFSGNQAGYGGGMYNNASSPALNNTSFIDNRTSNSGGGIYNTSNSSPTLTNVIFDGNQAMDGGGMCNETSSSPTLTEVIFSNNTVTSDGGGIYNISSSSPVLSNVTFNGNQAAQGGGINNELGSNPVLTNVLFSGNQADFGGGMYNYDSDPTLINVTMSGNWASFPGGGIENYCCSAPRLINSILWGNSGPQIHDYNGTSAPVVTYSDVQGGYSGTGNLDIDPLFVAPITATVAPTTTGNYRLSDGSPVIDAGNNLAIAVPTDMDDNPRIAGTAVDLGAYEWQYVRLYVDQNAPGPAHDGTSWATAYLTLTGALEEATYGYEIWVADGVYTPTNTIGLTATFALKPGVALYGGFGISETLRTQRDWTIYKSILSGDLDGNDLNANGNFIAEVYSDIVGNNAYHVVTGSGVTETAVLDGFIVTAGNANSYPNDEGGGMYNNSGSPMLVNLTFSGNQANYGGGINNINSGPSLTNVTFSGNRASSGAGIFNHFYSSPMLTNVTFSRNQGTSRGGGMYNIAYSSPTLTNVTFKGNQAGSSGGGMYNYSSSNPMLTNVTFSSNQADSGGGLYNDSSSPSLTNVTFSGNMAVTGGGMFNATNSNPFLVNCILWGDSDPEIHNINSAPIVTYSDVQGGYEGTGNLDVDPLFVAPITATLAPTTTGNYRLGLGSPAIDVGNNLSVTIATDLDGNPRIVNGIVDLGVYEAPYLRVWVNKYFNSGDGIVTSLPEGINCGPTCAYSFLPNTVVTLTATPFISSTFTLWWGASGTSTANPITLTVDTAKGVEVIFTLKTYFITPTVGVDGTIMPDMPQIVSYGADQMFTITPDSGYHILDVGVDRSSIGVVTAYTFTNVTADHTITAAFAINTFTLTPTAGAHGTLTPDTPQTVDYGASQMFTITPNVGYHIADVGVDGASIGAVSAYTFTNVTANHTITAAFAINTYILMPTAGANGGITPSTPQTVNYGASQLFTITPNTGYHIADVGVDGASIGVVSAYTFTNVTANHIITAAFAVNAPSIYTLTVMLAGKGQGQVASLPPGLTCASGSCTATFDAGTVVTLTATPLTATIFTGWSGAVVTTTNPLVLPMDAAKRITATFHSYKIFLPLIRSGS